MQGFFILSFFNLLNKIFSFVRIAVQAMFLGDGLLNDSFTLANRTLSLFRRVAVDGNLETMIISFYKTNRNPKQFAGKIVTFLLMILVVISGCVTYFNGFIAKISGVKLELVGSYKLFLTYMSPIIPLMFLISVFSGILNANKRFILSAPATFFGNICNLGAIIFLHPIIGIFWSLVIGSLLYSFMPVVFMLPGVINYMELPKNILLNENEQEFFKKSASSAIWQNIVAISDYYTHNQAAKLATGSMSALEYGHKIIHFIYSIIAVSLSSVFSVKLSGESQETQKKLVIEGFMVTHVLSIMPCLFVILYGSIVAKGVFGGMTLIKNLELISDNFMVCGISLYFLIQNRILNTVLLTNKYVNITIVASLIFAVINGISSYMYCSSIISLSWGCNVATMIQFMFLLLINIFKNYLVLNWRDLIDIGISSLSAYVMTQLVNYTYNLQILGNLCSPIFDRLPILKPLAGSFDILLPFIIFYIIHMGINYKYTKKLFEKNRTH
jgi:putative peptidoglycan lipid II flippase